MSSAPCAEYQDQVLPDRRVKAVLPGGAQGAPARAMLRAVGFNDDFDEPQVGIAAATNDVTPCNMALSRLAAVARRGVTDSGGVGLGFSTIAVSSGIAMGHVGMRASLPSRDLIADSVECMAQA